MKSHTPLAMLFTFGLSTAAVAAAPAAAPASAIVPAPGYTIKNCVTAFDPAKVEKTAVGYQFWFADTALADRKTVKLSVVGPHLATHSPHRHAEDEFFFILEGSAEYLLDGETRVVGPQTLLYCPSWHLHGIRNVGSSVLKYLVIKKYNGPVPPPSGSPVRSPDAAEPPAE